MNPNIAAAINPNLTELLRRTDAVLTGYAKGWHPDPALLSPSGIETVVPGNPLFVTPLGIAMHN